MTCADVDRLLSEGTAIEELKGLPEVRQHLRQCGRCQELLAWMETPPPEVAMEDAAAERIRALLHADLTPVRPAPSTAVGVAAVFALAAMIALLHGLAMGSRGWERLSPVQAASLGVFAVVAIFLTALSLLSSIRPGSPRRMPARVPILVVAAGFPIAVCSLFPMISSEDFAAHGVRCLAGGLMVSAMTAGLTYGLSRRGYSTDWPVTGALIGTIGATVAVAALQVSCPELEVQHLVLWHGLTILLSIGGGYLAGRRTISP
jgi:hypothetical protein